MQVQTSQFSGPLDLLLQLIRREEMDIFDIDIHKITEQYLSSIETSFPDLDSAGDFIRMAALLIYIKSKSLFPSSTHADSEEPEQEDLKKALEQSLIKMRAVQDIAKKLYQYPLLNRDVWIGGDSNSLCSLFQSADLEQKESIKKQPLLALLRAYRRMFQGGKSSSSASLNPEEPVLSLAECIRVLRHRLISGTQLKMSTLMGTKNSLSQTLVTFLALLELGRLGIVSLKQEKEYSDIAILVQKRFNEKGFPLIQEIDKTHRAHRGALT